MSAVLNPSTATATVHHLPETLDDLVHQYVNAKHAEDGARQIRLQLEERILALQPAPEEGSTTVKLGNGFKLTATGKLTYKCADVRALAEACAGWPANMVPVKTKIELDETACKHLRATEPQAWAGLARFITVAPAKTAIKVAA
jgi:hypothetical protein